MTADFWDHIQTNAKKSGEPFFSLAPMEAVTDSVFRQVVAKAAAPDVFNTEFTNALSITHPKAKFSVMGRLHVSPNEQQRPVVQLWGDQPEAFARAAEAVKNQGFKAIDLNMGCPDSTVVKNGGGSDLIRHMQTAADVIAASKMAGLPVSVKTRLGFSRVDEMNDWLPWLLRQDVRVLTVHLRTRKEMSKVSAHFELIDQIVKMRDKIAPQTMLQINGDIKTRRQGIELAEQHPGLDGIMIGRGIFENPYCFEKTPQRHSLGELLDLFGFQLDLYDQYVAEVGPKRFEALRRFFKIYVRGLAEAAKYRDRLVNTHSSDEARAIITELRERACSLS
ncbi:tRNA dihydrouridine synthase [Oenococcus kitaharae]|uniref:tRNA-dihydrouridine synthase n=1 Tax=Oenococcus kitaharae DSM 17330 TaxID=1045004 RepID=G9WGS2_9LACO|nr:tRNA-dihydrouridine synthase [Oenococcus kitaharae]EHN59899.1 tRNA dihydrouridine synthase B [Oenococcus kitaharae DSM 17330]OEY82089.1 tRNA-dihydrouridine synthase [Oenococcus kitaharae]OEY82456.1 tRNA-dihydrouridine synthase [Oenococcus kitaharae]OEY83802.1 tRNA-dihydrouridine synthase [Oenococcus kitaharae]